MNQNAKVVIPIIAILLLALFVYAGVQSQKDTSAILPDNGFMACDQDAMMCPDGSSVGRVPPKCEFAQCPSSSVDSPNNPPQTEPVACTMDALVCPDGSFVGRVPPKCEFAQCPAPNTR